MRLDEFENLRNLDLLLVKKTYEEIPKIISDQFEVMDKLIKLARECKLSCEDYDRQTGHDRWFNEYSISLIVQEIFGDDA